MKNNKSVNLAHLFLIIISSLFISACSDDITNSGDNRDPYEIKVWDYSDNHYLLDTIYKQSYFDFYNNLVLSQQTNALAVDEQSFEVWVQIDPTPPDYRKAALYIDLPELPSNGVYNDSFKVVTNLQQGINAFGFVRKLHQSEYVLNKYAGFISLKINLQDNYFAGVAYKRPITGEQFGTISTDGSVSPTDTLVLKMIKVENLVPQNLLAWELKLKNIYQLPKTNISEQGFEFNIQYHLPGVEFYPFFLDTNNYIITILGLDKYSSGSQGTPDKKFDFIPGLTINPENGWIIFPTLKPFLTNLQSFNPPIDSVYWYPQIYSNLKSESNTSPNANNYIMQGYITR